jgi:hypothetical protein
MSGSKSSKVRELAEIAYQALLPDWGDHDARAIVQNIISATDAAARRGERKRFEELRKLERRILYGNAKGMHIDEFKKLNHRREFLLKKFVLIK